MDLIKCKHNYNRGIKRIMDVAQVYTGTYF